MKKIISVFLSVFIMMSAVTASTVSATVEKFGKLQNPFEDGWEYYVENGEAHIIKFWGSSNGDITIPSQLGGFPVKTVEYFTGQYGDTNFITITISDGITSIGGGAFSNCESLKSVTIPNSVTSIGGSTFVGCISLTSITIPNSVTSIGEDAFKRCTALTSINIPDSVTLIDSDAFLGCESLTDIKIGKSVEKIGDEAFQNCISLVSVVIPESVTSIGFEAFSGCSSLANIKVSDNISHIGENAIAGTAFYDNKENWYGDMLYLGKYLVDTYTSISGYAQPKEETLMIANGAFRNCDKLNYITIPDSVIYIGNYAFYGCLGLKIVDIIPYDVEISIYAFTGGVKCTFRCSEGSTAEKFAMQDNMKRQIACINADFSLKDESKKIIITNKDGNTFGENDKLIAVENTDKRLNSIASWDFPEKAIKILNISLRKDGINVQPKKEVSVVIEVPSGVNINSCYVYAFDENQDYIKLPLIRRENTIKFSTSSLGNFLLVRDMYNTGDVNGDGYINAADALTILQSCVDITELNEQQFKAADVDFSGKVSSKDALVILQFTVGVIDKFSAQQ